MGDSSTSIFGSPLKLEFGAEDQISNEMLEENLRNLAETNEETLSKATPEDGLFSDGVSAELVFSIVEKLSLPNEVKYFAVEIFDKFMRRHISELFEVVRSSSCKDKRLDWDAVEARIKDQVQLRAVSCIQIASKLVSHYTALSPYKVKRYLSSCGLHYSLTSVGKSEMRVLQTLEFRLPSTSCLTYINIILEVLHRNCPGLEIDLVHSVSLKMLDLMYLKKIQVCEKLSQVAEVSFDANGASDLFLIAVVVVAAAAYVIDSTCSDEFVEQLSLITCVDEADIILFSSILVNVTCDKNEDEEEEKDEENVEDCVKEDVVKEADKQDN